jgi:distribution and morphology protein 31
LHRPTKDELLAAATSFWQRLGIRFKWFSIRSFRPYTLDEIGAFISWIFLGHVVWIIVGTTTFVSLAIWAVNTVFAQETLAGWVGNYLTKSSGIKIVFESAIVPTWRSGVITFNNVFVSRRPGQQSKERSVIKGSSTTAAAAASAAMSGRSKEATPGVPEDDGNYTQFDVTINTVNVTLSFSKWFNGKGLLHDVEIVGVRGVIDRTSVQKTDHYIDPKSYRHEHDTGDFEIDVFKMSDVLLSVYQPDNFRPFTVSVFNCELPRLRKQWLFYDFMSANNMSGSFDDSLFTVHPRQVHGHTGAPLTADGVGEDAHWKKHSRLRIDGLNIDHLNRGVEGPFGWIHEGNVDIVADVMIPSDEDSIWRQSFKRSAEAMSEFYDRLEHSVTQQTQAYGKPPHTPDSIPNAPENISNASTIVADPDPSTSSKFVLLDIRVHLNDVRASIPLVTRDLSYINNALVRPIVAYINSRRAFIPVTCRVVKRQSEFDGSWTVFDSGLMDDLSREVYDAFARDVSDDERRGKRMRKVGRWVVELVVEALFLGLAGQLA